MKRTRDLVARRDVARFGFQGCRGDETSQRFNALICAFVSLWLVFNQALGGISFANTTAAQGQLISLGILSFQDESGTEAPPQLGQKIAQDLQQKLNATHKDILARSLSVADASSIKTMTVEQLAALGKQYGVKFVVRGGLLGLTSDNIGDESKTTAQLYAEIVSVETGGVSSVRAEGEGTQKGAAIRLNSINLTSTAFRNSAIGQALAGSIEQLTESIHQAIVSPAPEAEASESQPQVPDSQPQAPTDAGQSTDQADTAQTQEAAAAEADEELQQLITQAESLLSNSSAKAKSLKPLSKALKGLKAALDAKASLLEKGKETAQADQEIAARKQELQSAISNLSAQSSSDGTATSEGSSDGEGSSESSSDGGSESDDGESGGEKKNILATINEFLSEAMNIIQKIQEMRAAFRAMKGDSSSGGTTPSDTGSGGTTPSEEPTGEVNGAVTDSGNPVEGATVTDPESGVSATTDSDGSYVLKNIASGRLVKLLVKKAGKQITSAQIYMPRGRSATADFDLKASSPSLSNPGLRILPSKVLIGTAKTRGAGTGEIKGIVRDAQGKPLARTLVNLKGLGVARTDSQGQYEFRNVPAGTHQLIIRKSGLKLRMEQVQVTAKKTSETKVLFAGSDKILKETSKQPLVLRGTGTILRGAVLDNDKRPVAGAKVTVIQAASAVSVLTGPGGSYELRDLKPGTYRVLISKVGYEGGTEIIALRPGAAEERNFQMKKKFSPVIDRVLQTERTGQVKTIDAGRASTTPTRVIEVKKGQLTGRVVDAQSGKPIPGATVSIQSQQSVKTDLDGNYTIMNLTLGLYKVSVIKIGFSPYEKSIMIGTGAATRGDFAMKKEGGNKGRGEASSIIIHGKNGQLRGQVTDAKSGKPIAGVTISVSSQRSVITDQLGNYAIMNLAPGSYQIIVRKRGFADAAKAVTVGAGQTVTANFTLNSATRNSTLFRLKLPKKQ